MTTAIIYMLLFIGFCLYLALGAFITDVILPKFPKVQKLIDRIIDNIF